MKTRHAIFTLMIALISAFTLPGCGNSERVHESWVAPNAAPAYDDSTIYARTTAGIQSDPELQGVNVTIKVTSGSVQLSGTVNNENQKNRVAMHAWMIDGVKNVDNQVALK